MLHLKLIHNCYWADRLTIYKQKWNFRSDKVDGDKNKNCDDRHGSASWASYRFIISLKAFLAWFEDQPPSDLSDQCPVQLQRHNSGCLANGQLGSYKLFGCFSSNFTTIPLYEVTLKLCFLIFYYCHFKFYSFNCLLLTFCMTYFPGQRCIHC